MKEILEEIVENNLKDEIEKIPHWDEKKKYIGASDAIELLIYKLCPKKKQVTNKHIFLFIKMTSKYI